MIPELATFELYNCYKTIYENQKTQYKLIKNAKRKL